MGMYVRPAVGTDQPCPSATVRDSSWIAEFVVVSPRLLSFTANPKSKIQNPKSAWWLGFVLAMLAALYSYLFSAFVLPAAALTLLGLAWFDRAERGARRKFAEGVGALAVTGVLFLPLAYNAWVVNAEEGTPGRAFADVGPTLWRLLRIFTVWRVDWPEWRITAALVPLALLCMAGLLWPTQGQERRAGRERLWLTLWVGVPPLIGHGLLARSASVFAEDRYFLFLAPFVLWAVARGAVLLGGRLRWAGLITGGLTVGLIAAALPQVWTPALYRENWRAAGDTIITYQQASPTLSAAVVAHVDYTRRPLERYLRRGLSAETVPLYFPFGGVLTPEQTDTVIAPPLQGIVDQGVATLWLTQSHLDGVDDGRLVEGWLGARFPLITEHYPTGIKVSGYAVQSRFAALPLLPASVARLDAELAPGLWLAACEILNPRLAPRDEQVHPPSGWVHLRLWWQATAPLTDNYSATAQLIGPEGVWGDRLSRDNEALRRWPTSTWQPGDVVRDEIDVNLNPVTPPRDYPLLIGLRDGAGQPVGLTVECGPVTIIE